MYINYLGVPRFGNWPGFPNNMEATAWTNALDKYIKSAQRGQGDYNLTCPNFKRMHPGFSDYGIEGTPYGQLTFIDQDGDGVVMNSEPTPDLYGGKPLKIEIVKHASELLIISESHVVPGLFKANWALGGPLNPMGYRSWPILRHPGGFPVGFLDGHAKSYRPVEKPSTSGANHYPEYPEPIYWPDIPDNWWIIH